MDNTRRNFIKNTTLGTVSLATATLSSNFVLGRDILGANERINCAVVGVRSRGKAHAAAINLKKTLKFFTAAMWMTSF